MSVYDSFHYNLNSLLNGILDKARNTRSLLKKDESKKHLDDGMILRTMFLKENIREIIRILSQEDGQISDDNVTLNIHLNSFYIHLKGLIDNATWILQFELNIIENNKNNILVNLTNKKFNKHLSERFPLKDSELQEVISWLGEIKNFRDPIVHRLPLFVPFRVLSTSEDFDEYNKNMDEYVRLSEEGNSRQAIDFLIKAKETGNFKPNIIVQNESLKFPGLLPTIKNDIVRLNKSVSLLMDLFET